MKFIADIHIQSKDSRATSKNLDLENLYIAAQLKDRLETSGNFENRKTIPKGSMCLPIRHYKIWK